METKVEGIQFIESLAPWKGSGVFSTLNVQRVLKALGNPQNDVPAIHIAGTNGKGSVCALLSSILSCSGYSVGVTTSPHLDNLRERIVIGGKLISPEKLNEIGILLKSICNELTIELTFFEAITISAFLHFKREGSNINVVEVGLGGRLDATNTIERPKVTAITSISIDHTALLGNSEYKIAKEKAGIFREGVPMVVGELSEEAMSGILEVIKDKSIPVSRSGHSFGIGESSNNLVYWDKELGIEAPITSSLRGTYQRNNIGVAIKCALLAGSTIEECQKGVATTKWPGRYEIIEGFKRLILLDGAHNRAGIRGLVESLRRDGFYSIDLLFAVSSDKEWKTMVDEIAPLVRSLHIVEFQSERALPSKVLGDYISSAGINFTGWGNRVERAILETSSQSDTVPLVIAGSLYLISEAREVLKINR